MKHESSDFTRLEPVASPVQTINGNVPYLEWCQKEVERIGPKASVRIVEGPTPLCCVKLEGYQGEDND